MRFQDRAGNFSEVVSDVPLLGELFDNSAGSDKSISVPGNQIWRINFVQGVLTTTATAGNRMLSLTVTNKDSNLILTVNASVTQAASQVRTYTGFQGQFRETFFVNNEIHQPIPIDFYLQPGSVIRFYDTAGIDAVGDTLIISGSYTKFPGWKG